MTMPAIQPTKGFGDIANAVALASYDISQVGAGTITVYTPASGKTFLIYYLYLQNKGVGANLIQLISNVTGIGRLELGVGGIFEFKQDGFPFLVGRATADPFKITVATDTIGTVTVGYR